MRLSGTFVHSAIGVVALIATACAPAAAPPQSTGSSSAPAPAAAPAVPQKLTLGMSLLVDNLDPHAVLGRNARRYGLFETLVAQKDDGAIIPELALSWKNINDTTWEFKLATGRKWHDGKAVTAEDIKYSFDRVLDPANKLAALSRIPTVQAVTIVDPTTITVVTKGPDPVMLRRLAALAIVPKAYIEQIGPAEFTRKAIGSGPFKLKEVIPSDRLVLVRDPEHPSKPALEEVTLRFVPDGSARLAGLRTGELQAIDRIPLDQSDRLKTESYKLVIFDTGRDLSAQYNVFLDSPVANKLVRQALNYAIDKETIAKTIYRGLTRIEQGQIIQPETFGFNPKLKPYPYDPKKAKELLAQAGYPNGFNGVFQVWLSSAEWEPLALFMQQQLKDIGVNFELETTKEAAIFTELFYGRQQRKELFTTGYASGPAMDASFAFDWFRGNQPDGTKRYANAEFDRYYNASQSELNEQKRLEALNKAAEIMYEDPPVIFLVHNTLVWATAKNIDGFSSRIDEEPLMHKLKITN